jgi:SAM-dependent methyltransferase
VPNIDPTSVASFGAEWGSFDQSRLTRTELQALFDQYFAIFPWDSLPPNAEGFDMGCGAGRWAAMVAGRVGKLHCIDPSNAIDVAKRTLTNFENVTFERASLDDHSIALASQDFGYCLGVLHHVPNACDGIRSCAELLKSGAPLLLYLYYAFDNRPWWFRIIWRISDALRVCVSSLPDHAKTWLTDVLAMLVYWPLARGSKLLEQLGAHVDGIPLSFYRAQSFYTMRTDSRDRFGTPLERRFTKIEIEAMMRQADLMNIRFSDAAPFWCVVGFKA